MEDGYDSLDLKPEHVPASARAHVDSGPLDVKTYGEWLKALREERGLTLAALGELTGYSTSHLSQVETGKKKYLPAPEYLEKLAPALNVGYSDLLQLAGYDDLAKGVRLREAQEIFGDADLTDSENIAEIVDLRKLLTRETSPFPIYNGHKLSRQECQQILGVLQAIFPQYQ
ncbi:helix-turn-helix domain-containing protein [Paenibacillus sp. FSL M7-0420]|uniref:helix-turn-helix domain-containing protein n=1 Tax=Paenibacillus sp. FSL M7-0420 TaxID=2921609 RepID=UPI0030F55EB9